MATVDPIALRSRDIARLERVDQLRASPELRARFGASATSGQSAILAALRWIETGDGEPDHDASTVICWPATGHVNNHQAVEHVGAESARALLVQGETGPLDEVNDRQRLDGAGGKRKGRHAPQSDHPITACKGGDPDQLVGVIPRMGGRTVRL